jgi:hypothetical protein
MSIDIVFETHALSKDSAGDLWTPETELLWGGKLSNGLALVFAAIEAFEGRTRLPCPRRRRSHRGLPAELTDVDGWMNETNAVSRVLHIGISCPARDDACLRGSAAAGSIA